MNNLTAIILAANGKTCGTNEIKIPKVLQVGGRPMLQHVLDGFGLICTKR